MSEVKSWKSDLNININIDDICYQTCKSGIFDMDEYWWQVPFSVVDRQLSLKLQHTRKDMINMFILWHFVRSIWQMEAPYDITTQQ